jgi:hypothetical protein
MACYRDAGNNNNKVAKSEPEILGYSLHYKLEVEQI